MNKPRVTCDVENLVGFFSIQFQNIDTGESAKFATWWGGPPLDLHAIVDILARHTVYTFNGNNYDLPIIVLALYGADLATLKQAGDAIILGNMKPWTFYKRYGIQVPDYIDHVDVMEVAPGVRIGLKMYAGRIHAPQMQDLPVDPMMPVGPALYQPIMDYCDNDLEVTGLLVDGLSERLALRDALTTRYRVDLRSKSDAQIAEAVIKAKLDFVPQRRYIQHGYSFKYEPPDYIGYSTPKMRKLLDDVRAADFVVTDKEEAIILYGDGEGIRTGVNIPESLKGRDIALGRSVYRMGIGGLHSQESSVSYYALDGWTLMDIDVASYYPALILTMGMYPEQLGPAFLRIYEEIRAERLAAKAEFKRLENLVEYLDGEDKEEAKRLMREAKTTEGGLKIVLNGTFGKLFSKYSIFYAPEFGIKVTLTGQLALLMLIEMMEMSGIPVISANTDGIVLAVPPGLADMARDNVKWWERRTGLDMEYSHYRSIHLRDVNNYVAITTDGKAKRKGVFAKPGLIENKHPDKAICADAVVEYLLNGTPVEQTIRACTDIRQFLVVRAVTGGGVYKGQYLGKAVRWYYGCQQGHIERATNGDKVAGSDGATPIMRLPDSLPADIDYQHYVEVAMLMLSDIGIPVQHWYHSESDSVLTTFAGEDWPAEHDCNPIDRKTYDKRK